MSGHERVPDPAPQETDRSGQRANRRPPDRPDPNDPRVRAAARLALDRSGVRDPAQVREERAARVAPALGRTALSKDVERKPLPARDAQPDEPKRDRPAGRDG